MHCLAPWGVALKQQWSHYPLLACRTATLNACAAASELDRPANRTATMIPVLHCKSCLGLDCRTVMMMGRQGAASACCTCCRTPRLSM